MDFLHDIKGSLDGNAGSASKWAAARSISLTGAVTGSVNIDGSGNTSMVTTVIDDSHNHIIGNIDNLQATLNIKEDYQTINTVRNNLGTPTVREMALFHGQFNNKFRFIAPTLQEESVNGVDWVVSTRAAVNTLKDMMIGEGQGTSFTAIPAPGIGGMGCYRLTWVNAQAGTGYIFLNNLYVYCSTNGNTVTFKVEAYHNTSGWTTLVNANTNNWPGHVSIPHNSIPFSTSATQYGQIRITFTVGSATNANPFSLYAIEWFGGYPAGRRNVESYDRDRNVTFPANIEASAFNKSDGQVMTSITVGIAQPASGWWFKEI